MSTRGLTKKQFYQINRSIRDAINTKRYNADALGGAAGVSAQTIRRVRQAKTWNGWLALKSSRQISPKTSPVEKELATNIHGLEKRVARADAAGLSPRIRDDRAEELFAEELTKLQALPTREELELELKAMHRRIDILSAMWRALSRNRTFNMLYGRIVRDAIAKLDESGDK
jgi:hypothetical protein